MSRCFPRFFLTALLALGLPTALAACDAAPPSAPALPEDVPCRRNATASAVGTWEALSGPEIRARRLRLFEPYLYAVANRDGLFRLDLRSGDAAWEPLGLAEDAVRGIEGAVDVLADAGDPARLLATADLTGDSSGNVFRSLDAGQTWETDGEILSQRLYGEGDGEPPGSVLAVDGGVHRSPDFGQTWESIREEGSPNGWGFNPSARHSAAPDVLWTGSELIIFTPDIRRSLDGGRTWEQVDICPPACGEGEPTAFAFDPLDGGVTYLSLAGTSRSLIKTEDYGATWRALSTGFGHYYHRDIMGDPEMPGRVWAALILSFEEDPFALIVSEDAGATWAEVALSEVVDPEAAPFSLAWDAVEEALLVGTDRGVYRYRPGMTTGLECE